VGTLHSLSLSFRMRTLGGAPSADDFTTTWLGIALPAEHPRSDACSTSIGGGAIERSRLLALMLFALGLGNRLADPLIVIARRIKLTINQVNLRVTPS
jgi:hypothetical protein